MQKNVFISYTLRDNRLSKTKLNEFKNALKTLNFLSTFIDALDNNDAISPQNEVMAQLMRSDVVWLIDSAKISESKWVLKEIEIAIKYNKSIHKLSVETMDNIIQAKDSYAILKIIQNYV